MRVITAVALLSILVINTVGAGEADVLKVEVERTGDNSFHFDVTVLHNDEGWDHYADAFEILDPEGNILATRTLYHPHVNEQPFTRSIGNVEIPYGIGEVTVRARDSVHEYGGAEIAVKVPR